MVPIRSAALIALVLAACGGSVVEPGAAQAAFAPPPPSATVPPGTHRVLATNDLGMHCIDADFSVFSILPPFNVVRAQVLERRAGGTPRLLGPAEVNLTYEGVADGGGSINTRSVGKTNFWQHAPGLFGVQLPVGMGLTGLYMPADAPAPGPQPVAWKMDEGLFEAFGIPITPVDDVGGSNPYPLMRLRATSVATGATLATLDVVLPVSSETDCRNCHLTGGIAANDPSVTWSTSADPEVQSRENVLLLHDARWNTELFVEQPVLCATCHRSPPLEIGGGGGGQPGTPYVGTVASSSKTGPHTDLQGASPVQLMSAVMHDFHGRLTDSMGNPIFPPNGDALSTCYQCHPGAVTECLRGAMKNGGMACLNCHGDMLSVGGAFPLAPGGSIDGTNDLGSRRPWQDLPRCQSCHTGDALSHLTGPGLVFAPDGIRLMQAYRTGDPAASPIASPTSRFAENAGSLYRFSKGHAGISCENCHGSTHAEWPNAVRGANDNVAATELQGHTGTIAECATCHAPGTLAPTMNGPHGMHNVDDPAFVDHQHANFYELSANSCRACHGANLLGSPLARAAAPRSWVIEGQAIVVPKGGQIACNLCHTWPVGGD